jgi:predicted TIM-barrel fold metal-dependent hydrolase
MNNPQTEKPGRSRRDVFRAAGGIAFAGALAGERPDAAAGQAPQKMLPDDVIIDVHIHAVPTGLPGEKPESKELAQLFDGPPEALARSIRKEMEEARIAFAFGMGAVDGPADDPLGVSQTLKLAELVPGLRAIGIADPRRTDRDHLAAVERQLDRERGKIVALKAYLGYIHVGPEDPSYVPYYRLAEKYGLPVIFHTGDNWSTKAKVKYAHPLRIDEVAVDHPGVRFVMAHVGNPWLIDAAEVLYKNENVYADLSGLAVGDAESIGVMIKAAALGDAAKGVLIADLKNALAYAECPDRILYGSDWPLAPMPAYRKLIETIVPKEHHAAVFRTNAERLFGLKV